MLGFKARKGSEYLSTTSYLVVKNANTIARYNLATGVIEKSWFYTTATFSGHNPTLYVDSSANIYTAGNDTTPPRKYTSEGTIVQNYPVVGMSAISVTVNENTGYFYVGATETFHRVYKPDGTLHASYNNGTGANSFCREFCPVFDKGYYFVTGRSSGNKACLSKFDLNGNRTEFPARPVVSDFMTVAYNRTLDVVMAGEYNTTVIVYYDLDGNTLRTAATTATNHYPVSMVFDDAAQMLYVAATPNLSGNGAIYKFNTMGQLVWRYDITGLVFNIALRNDGRVLVAARPTGTTNSFFHLTPSGQLDQSVNFQTFSNAILAMDIIDRS